MALGYALLHPGRVELALGAAPSQVVFDDLTDVVMSLVGGGDPGSAATAFLDGVRGRIESVGQLASGLTGAGGPFGAITSFLSGLSGSSGMPDLAAWLDRIIAFLEALAPETLRQKLGGWIDALLQALPVLDSHQMFLTVRDLLSQALEAFEKPFLDGRRDAAAHRLVRAATVAHSYLDSMLENLEDTLGGFSLRPMLERFLGHVFGALSFTGLDRVVQTARDLRDALGPILTAMSNLSLSFTVSVSVGGPAGQPATEPTWRNDGVPTPHMPGHALWWTDLITNLISTFNLLWEMIRTAPWHRPVEVILSVVEIAWQLVRTLVRAICPAKLNTWDPFPRWLFTDQAQFCIGLILRFLGSFHEAFAAPNYFLGAGLRLLRYYSYALSPRMFYLFARSAWYLQSWKADPWVLGPNGQPTTTKAPISIVRYCWATWPVMWATGIFFGSFLPWRDYNIAEMSGLTLAMFIVGTLVAWGAALVVVFALGGEQPFGYPLERDFGLFVLWAIAAAWVALLAVAAMAGVNQLVPKAPWVGLGLGVVLLVLFIGLGASWGGQSGDNSSPEALVFGGILIHFTGIMAFGLISVVLWWYYVNEGRDAEGYWNGLDAGSSPYRLPYPRGQTYFCGQANHGVFSHYQSSPGNRYSYDFNDAENKPIWAAREGVVVEIREVRPNGSGEPNFIVVQHLDWVTGHDPGSEKERAFTYSNYWHLSRDHLWVREGQRVGQGQHIADLDDTGISALHHLHFGVNSFQRDWFHGPEEEHGNIDNGEGGNIPIVFADPSVRGFRNYPLLFSWLPGGGHHPGKPIAMSFYESSNTPHEPEPQAMAVKTSTHTATGVASHQHEIHLDASIFVGGALPAGDVWVRTTRHQGHFHAIKLTRANLVHILQRRDLPVLTTSEALGHTHTLENDSHGVTTYPSENNNNPPNPISTRSNVRPLIIHPPPGQVQARKPGPYHLLGEQLVLRVNDRVTEYYLYGASRSSAIGDVALDRAPKGDLEIDAAGSPHTSNVPAADLAVRQAVRALNHAARTAGRSEAFRAVPVLIIETRQRGTGATLQVTGGTAADALGLAGQQAVGTGVSADFDAMSASALGDLLRDGLNHAWPADSVHVTAAMTTGGTLALHASSNALEFESTPPGPASSTPRIAAVLKNLYRHAGNTPGATPPAIQATGALPLGTGRLVLRHGATGWSIPVLGTPARVQLDLAHAALSGPGRAATPLRVRLRATATEQQIWFRAGDGGADPGDGTPEAMARRITAEAEGVRAWVAGGQIVVETVAAGQAVDLYIDKDAPTGTPGFSVTSKGAAPAVSPAPAGTPVTMDDATALPPDLLRTIIEDAKWRAAQGPNPSPITASVDASAIVLERAGATLDLVHDGTGLGFTASSGKLRSLALPTARALPGGWLDVRVGAGPVLRAVLDAEPARIDGAPLKRLPGTGTITLTVNGAARSATFGANVRNAFDVATELASQIPEIVVRVGYRLAVETVLPHGPSPRIIVNPATAAAGAGFGHALPLTVRGWGEVDDPLAVISKLSGPGELGRRAARHVGPLIPGFTVSEDGNRIKLTARTPENLLAVHALGSHEVHDPLHLAVQPGGPAHQLASSEIATAIDLGSHCVGYRVAVEDAGAIPASATREILAETIVQISAAPATAVTTLAPQLAALPAGAGASADVDRPVLKLVITPPGGAASTAAVDLRGVSDLEEVADRINAAVPDVAAWADQTRGYATTAHDRLHIQTRGGGKLWKLRLQGHHVLAVLGFDPAAMIEVPDADSTRPPAYVVEVNGRGNVNDGAAATRAELKAIFDQSAEHLTQLDDLAVTPPVRRAFLVEHGPVPPGTPPTTARDLVVHAAAGAVTVSTSPPHLATRLHVTADAARTRIAPGSTHVALDNGVIRVSVAGRLAAAAELYGWSALLIAPNPLPTDAAARQQQLAYLDTLAHGNGIDLAVDHGRSVRLFDFPPPPAPIPPGATGFEAVIARLGERVPGVWFGVVDQGGARHFAMQSRTRGRRSHLALDLRSIPASGLLGWNQSDGTAHSVAGGGNVDNLDHVSLVDLKRLLEDARSLGAGPQSLLDARVSSAKLQLVALSPGASLSQTSGAANTPGGVSMTTPAGRTDMLESAYAGGILCHPGLATFEASTGTQTRGVRALVWGTPARLPEMRLPSQPAQLEGKTLSIRVDGAQHDVTFAGIAGPVERARARVVAQIEAGCAWQVRAHLRGSTLVIETRHEGASATIALLAATNDARGLLGITATGEVGGTAGAGSVPNLAAVEADHYRAALASTETAFVNEAGLDELARCRDVPVDLSGCEPRDLAMAPDAPRFVRIASNRDGCMSSVIPLVDAPSLALDRTLARGPAVRASVKLDAFAGERTLPTGELEIVLQGNPTAPDHPPEIHVLVRFDAGNYTAQKVADRIHQELFQRGAGMAACYPDNTVVVETMVNGIAGAIALPGPATTPALASALHAGTPVCGWPGMGSGAIRAGFRSEPRAPRDGTIWKFSTERIPNTGWEAEYKVLPGTDIRACARALDAKLANAAHPSQPNRRIGMAAVGADGCLYIEATGLALFLLQVDGKDREVDRPTLVQKERTLAPRPPKIGVEPARAGEGFEEPVEPGLGLRRTDTLRTVRYVRDGFGAGIDASMDDLGWVRAPSYSRTGAPSFFWYWPAGRYRLALRADAACINDYDGNGDMIASHGADPGDPSRGFVHQARYWVGMTGTREFYRAGFPVVPQPPAGSHDPTHDPDFWTPYRPYSFGPFVNDLDFEPLGLRRVGADLAVEMVVWWKR